MNKLQKNQKKRDSYLNDSFNKHMIYLLITWIHRIGLINNIILSRF